MTCELPGRTLSAHIIRKGKGKGKGKGNAHGK